MSYYYSVPLEQCEGTSDEILRSFKLCGSCKKLPFKQVVDNNNNSLIYCEICALENKFQMKIHQYPLQILNKLIINCKEFCGQKFNYNQRSELEEHEYLCTERVNESKDFCKKCKNFFETGHDCITSLNKKIDFFQKDLTYLMDKFDNKFQNISKWNNDLQLEIKRLHEKLESINQSQKNDKKVVKENVLEEIKVNKKIEQIEENIIKKRNKKKKNLENVQNQNENIVENTNIQNQQNILINIPKVKKNNAQESNEKQRVIKNDQKENQCKLLENFSISKNLYNSNDKTDDITFGLIYNKIYLITASKSIRIYDLENFVLLDSMGNQTKGYINSLVIMSKTHTLVSGGDDYLIKFWDLNHLKEILESRLNNTSEVCTMLQYNESTLITGGFDTKIRFFDISKKTMIKYLEGHTKFIFRLLLLKDSETLVSGSQDHKFIIWKNNKIFKDSKKIHNERIECLIQLEFDKNIMISGDRHGKIALWDIKKEFTLISTIEGKEYDNSQGIYNLNIYELKKRNLLITASSLSVIAFWDLKTWKVLKSVKLERGLNLILPFEDEEKLIMSTRNTDLVLWG